MSTDTAGSSRRRIVRSGATTFAARRMENIVGRFYAVALLLGTFEVTTNALEQRHLLSATGFWLIFGAYLISNLSVIVANLFFEASSRWYLLNAVVILLAVVAWPLAVPNPAVLPSEFTPFVWWMTGWAGISAGLALAPYLAFAYMVVLPTAFALVQGSASGGSSTPFVVVQDAVYTFLISSVLTGGVLFLRWQAQQVDLAAETAAARATEDAAEEALAEERLNIASLVHNQVLGALNTAVVASSPDEKRLAADLAASAIERLSHYEEEVTEQPKMVASSSLFSSITRLVQEQTPLFVVTSSTEGELAVPVEVANAVTAATLQAVTNSLMHAGTQAKRRTVSLRSHSDSIKVTVVDDGKGFWLARVPKNRLGIRMVIFRRINEVGAESHIISKPGQGTTVVLEWRNDA